jgi:hypothetical protein
MRHSNRLVFVVALGCSSPPSFPPARFSNAPPVTIVDDRRNVPTPPQRRLNLEMSYGFNELYVGLVTRSMELPRVIRARGVNAMDEVPDSTWFTNRGELSTAQMRTGPVTLDNPELHTPWTIHSTKYGGASPGFIVTDTRGVKYVLKFDDANAREVETGTDVVVDRLLWAAGYGVPEDQVVYIRPEQLVLAPDAVKEDKMGNRRGRLDAAGVAAQLAVVAHEPDGTIRGSASRWIEGMPLGGPPSKGVRKDDPNDRIAHQDRRDLRGMFVVYAWLDMVDVWPGNFLDVWRSDPSEPNRHYVEHYALDFGLSLGTMAMKENDLRRGHIYRVDWPTILGSMFTFGLIRYEWESRPLVDIPGVATTFSAQGFDPATWHCDLPYLPFLSMDRFDGFWGAKIVAAFSRDQIRAAVEAGRFSDPRAVDYITDTLVARQRKTAAYWYSQVNPLDGFTLVDNRLCFDDLAIAQGYVPPNETTQYQVMAYTSRGAPLAGPVTDPAAGNGHSCVAVPVTAAARDAYTILGVTTLRNDLHGTTYVHIARDRDGVLRVIGLWRV